MKRFSLRNAFAHLKTLSLVTVAAVGLSSCGGGGGGGSDEKVVAPESMDLVTINFFNAFSMECSRLNGVAGSESGAAVYTRGAASFFLGVSTGSGTVGRNVQLPAVLTNVQYTYTRTSATQGRIVFTWSNPQQAPWVPGLTNINNRPAEIDRAYMFWDSGSSPAEDQLIVDVIYQDSGTQLINNTATIFNAYVYSYVDPVPATLSVTARTFSAGEVDLTASKLVTFKKQGVFIPTGYNPYTSITDSTPASAVWQKLGGRSVNLTTGAVDRYMNFITEGSASVPTIPGDPAIEDRGNVSIYSATEQAGSIPLSGTYSYARLGGDKARLAVRYTPTNPANSPQVTLQYLMDFDSLDSGTLSESTTSSTGDFDEDLTGPQN